MPEISRFFGIIVAMFYNDHAPPHFHVRYGNQKAVIAISTGSLLAGALSPRALGLVIEWTALHRQELRDNWSGRGGQFRLTESLSWSSAMLKEVVDVVPTDGYRLRVRFEDGVEGEVDLAPTLSFEGVFAPLRDPKIFRAVEVNRELGIICWPTGADVDSDVLYAQITGTPIAFPDELPKTA